MHELSTLKPTLISLPIELLRHILSFLVPYFRSYLQSCGDPSPLRNLFSVSLLCRPFYSLAQEFIYQCLDIHFVAPKQLSPQERRRRHNNKNEEWVPRTARLLHRLWTGINQRNPARSMIPKSADATDFGSSSFIDGGNNIQANPGWVREIWVSGKGVLPEEGKVFRLLKELLPLMKNLGVFRWRHSTSVPGWLLEHLDSRSGEQNVNPLLTPVQLHAYTRNTGLTSFPNSGSASLYSLRVEIELPFEHESVLKEIFQNLRKTISRSKNLRELDIRVGEYESLAGGSSYWKLNYDEGSNQGEAVENNDSDDSDVSSSGAWTTMPRFTSASFRSINLCGVLFDSKGLDIWVNHGEWKQLTHLGIQTYQRVRSQSSLQGAYPDSELSFLERIAPLAPNLDSIKVVHSPAESLEEEESILLRIKDFFEPGQCRPRLRKLDLVNFGNKVDLKEIWRLNGETLKSFKVHNAEAPIGMLLAEGARRVFSLDEVADIRKHCPLLEDLGIDIRHKGGWPDDIFEELSKISHLRTLTLDFELGIPYRKLISPILDEVAVDRLFLFFSRNRSTQRHSNLEVLTAVAGPVDGWIRSGSGGAHTPWVSWEWKNAMAFEASFADNQDGRNPGKAVVRRQNVNAFR